VVLVQPQPHLAQGDQARSGQDAGLTHAAAKDLALAPGQSDGLGRAGQQGADRRAKPLGEADLNRVGTGGDLLDGDSQGCRRVKQAGAVQVNRNPGAVGDGPDCAQVVERQNDAVRVGCLQADQIGSGTVDILGRLADGLLDSIQGHLAMLHRLAAQLGSGEDGRRPGFVEDDVAAVG